MDSTSSLTAVLGGPTPTAAPLLLGTLLTAHDVTVRIVEVEAYGGVGEDPASHAYRGRSGRNSPMFGAPGTVYVYFTYGMHWCANVACGPDGSAAAVLLRAGEVIRGKDLAHSRTRSRLPDAKLASGPARLARALGLDGTFNGCSMLSPDSPVRLIAPESGWPISNDAVCSGPRIGIRSATDWAWRFWVEGSTAVSSYRAAHDV